MRDNNKLMIGMIGALILFVIVTLFIVIPRGRNSNISNRVVDQPTDISEVVDITEQVIDVQQSADPTQSEIGEEQIIPTPRTGLESTDPASVNLASGEIQLVEAFAFW
jgi:hypothetical protein